ncbi:FAD-binding oxidoreductase [Nocardioides marmoriginsengisoli]|uniref:FAD-binding oxidoreductase n=1 Tax=Nocardioides marmoriginsengisoli TaxID=661483 RepID=A0A3N0CET6_9ACTN|nr:FAD-dependent oxidoreductase [Nocardioides marmoriginsengisoli]RNL61955.1 FAD-binding oxidoreductase [Nocardioides marmoriginsengisoli]
MQQNGYDAAIIGAGVIGCSIAYALARDGYRVCVYDRGGAAGNGSTSASSANIRFNYSTWEGVATAWESFVLWDDWTNHLGGVDEAGMARFIKTGGVVLDSPDQDSERVLALFDRAGIPYERWDAADIRSRLPVLDPSRYYPPKQIGDPEFWDDPQGEVGGYWVPDNGFVDDPALAAHNLMSAARRHGAEFRFNAPVTAIRREDGAITGVQIKDEPTVPVSVVVNAAGPHSAVVNALAGVIDDFNVGTRPMRQEVHQVPAPPGFGSNHLVPLVGDLDLGTYFRGTPNGDLLIGGTEPACDPMEWLDDPDEYNHKPTQGVFDAQVIRTARRLPSLAVPNAPRGIGGVYDVSDDWIPIYDKTSLSGYFVAIGTSGNQFKNAPIVGDLLASIIAASRQGRDHDTDPVQLTLPRTGHTIDLAHYSRKRKFNQDSSFSVMG